MLDRFRVDVRAISKGQDPKPHFVVTDHLFAIIYTCLNSFNRMTLIEYLQKCYTILQGDATVEDVNSISVHVICAAHMMKLISVALKKVEPNSAIRKAVMVMFSALRVRCSLNAAVLFYRLIYTILNSRQETESVTKARQQLNDICTGITVDEADDDVDEIHRYETDDVEAETVRTMLEKSPFTKAFKSALSCVDVSTQSTDSPVTNPT